MMAPRFGSLRRATARPPLVVSYKQLVVLYTYPGGEHDEPGHRPKRRAGTDDRGGDDRGRAGAAVAARGGDPSGGARAGPPRARPGGLRDPAPPGGARSHQRGPA